MKQEAHDLLFGIEEAILEGFSRTVYWYEETLDPIDNPFALRFITSREEINLIE